MSIRIGNTIVSGGNVPLVDALNSVRTDAALTAKQGKILDEKKIDLPSGGSVGNVLKKTASGVEWGPGGGGAQAHWVTFTTSGSSVSCNTPISTILGWINAGDVVYGVDANEVVTHVSYRDQTFVVFFSVLSGQSHFYGGTINEGQDAWEYKTEQIEETLFVEITATTSQEQTTYSANRSVQEIVEASNSNYIVLAKVSDSIIPLVFCSTNTVVFGLGEGGGTTIYRGRKRGDYDEWEYEEVDAFTGATASLAGQSGPVPAPSAGDNNKFLCGDGTWRTIGSQTPMEIIEVSEDGNFWDLGLTMPTNVGEVKEFVFKCSSSVPSTTSMIALSLASDVSGRLIASVYNFVPVPNGAYQPSSGTISLGDCAPVSVKKYGSGANDLIVAGGFNMIIAG